MGPPYLQNREDEHAGETTNLQPPRNEAICTGWLLFYARAQACLLYSFAFLTHPFLVSQTDLTPVQLA